VNQRRNEWNKLDDHQRKNINKQISRSARNDYRDYADKVLEDIEAEGAAGNTTNVFRLAKQLSSKQKGNPSVQPSIDDEGNNITRNEDQLECWAKFLEKKFAARPDEHIVDLSSESEETDVTPLTLDEVRACIKHLKSGKAAGPDNIPVEQYKSSDAAESELYEVLQTIWRDEDIPDNFALGDMLMHYKKKDKNDRSNYRALGLLNHGYKVFAKALLMRIIPYVVPQLSDMQAGFRKGRGCRDNILILMTVINHLMETAEDNARSLGIITYIDFTAAFDSILHSYLLNALKQYGVPLKYCRLVKAIYESAKIRVRLQERGGAICYSRDIDIRRGVIQGDIPSPVCFLVALDKLLKDHGGLEVGLIITDSLTLSDQEFADDAALANKDTHDATERLTHLDKKAQEEAGMVISVPKTKVQHIRSRPTVSATTEEDIANLPEVKSFKHICEKCGSTWPAKRSLSQHWRHCKKRRIPKTLNRKGTVADRIVTRIKVEQAQGMLDKVKIGDQELENVYDFVYLGCDIAGDGDQEVTVKHRCGIAWGKVGEYKKVLTSTKLPLKMRIRYFAALIVQPMTYGSEAWLFTKKIKQTTNGVASKILSLITRRTIHEEARNPTFSVIDHVMNKRWQYLGHILRMNEERTLRKFLLELQPEVAPYTPGSLMDDTTFGSQAEMIEAASDREHWRAAQRTRQNSMRW